MRQKIMNKTIIDQQHLEYHATRNAFLDFIYISECLKNLKREISSINFQIKLYLKYSFVKKANLLKAKKSLMEKDLNLYKQEFSYLEIVKASLDQKILKEVIKREHSSIHLERLDASEALDKYYEDRPQYFTEAITDNSGVIHARSLKFFLQGIFFKEKKETPLILALTKLLKRIESWRSFLDTLREKLLLFSYPPPENLSINRNIPFTYIF